MSGGMREIKLPLEGGIKPDRKGITGSTLKTIAMVSMLLDHIAFVLLYRVLVQRRPIELIDQQAIDAFFSANAELYFGYVLLRMCGRIAFPIFCFLLVEGFWHTRNLKKYLFRLFLFALISELPFDLAMDGIIFCVDSQNVYFTLFFGVLALSGIRMAEEKKNWHRICRLVFALLAISLCAGAAMLLKTDYNVSGVLVISVLYLLRRKKMLSMGLGCALLMNISAFVALLPVYFYNGRRGCNMKWVFYLFYPTHLFLLYLVAYAFGLIAPV